MKEKLKEHDHFYSLWFVCWFMWAANLLFKLTLKSLICLKSNSSSKSNTEYWSWGLIIPSIPPSLQPYSKSICIVCRELLIERRTISPAVLQPPLQGASWSLTPLLQRTPINPPEALNNPSQEQMPQCLRYAWMTNNPHHLHRSHLTRSPRCSSVETWLLGEAHTGGH